MAYQTGSASSSTDLLQKLITFLVANGWTQDSSVAEGLGWRVHAHLGSMHANLRAAENETPWARSNNDLSYGIHLYLGSGYNGSVAWNAQAGAPVGSLGNPIGVSMLLSAGPFSNYYFFCDPGGDNVAVVAERTPGLFVYLAWGATFQKAGVWTGGQYFFGSSGSHYASSTAGAGIPGYTVTSECPGGNKDGRGCSRGFVRADIDSYTGGWVSIFSQTAGADQGATTRGGDSSVQCFGAVMQNFFPVYAYQADARQFQFKQTSALDGRANLLPILLWVTRDGTATGYSMLGTIPNLFFTNAVGSGFSNAEEYVLGGSTYKLFPNFAVLKQ